MPPPAPDSRPAPLPFLSIKKIAVHYRPRAVVGIIAPWNYPVANAMMDAIGALAAGAAVLLKPSERTPLTAEVLLRGWLDSGAPEVLAAGSQLTWNLSQQALNVYRVPGTAAGTNTFNVNTFTGAGGTTQFWSADRGTFTIR